MALQTGTEFFRLNLVENSELLVLRAGVFLLSEQSR